MFSYAKIYPDKYINKIYKSKFCLTTKKYSPIFPFYKKNVYIYEMFMRDGLQSLKIIYPFETKKYFLENILKSNIQNIELGSTTDPELLPQMKDSFKLWECLGENKYDKNMIMLITNDKYLEKSLQNGIKSFGLVMSVSDSFGKSNLKKNAIESYDVVIEQMEYIYNFDKENRNINDYHIRVYLSCTFGDKSNNVNDTYIENVYYYVCQLFNIIKKLEVSSDKFDIVLCDTFGNMTYNGFTKIISKISNIENIMPYISLHIHTDGNFGKYIDYALEQNIYKFDSSLLGIGGCPFAGKKNIGNINTMKLIEYLENNNYNTGIDKDLLKFIENDINKEMNSFSLLNDAYKRLIGD